MGWLTRRFACSSVCESSFVTPVKQATSQLEGNVQSNSLVRLAVVQSLLARVRHQFPHSPPSNSNSSRKVKVPDVYLVALQPLDASDELL